MGQPVAATGQEGRSEAYLGWGLGWREPWAVSTGGTDVPDASGAGEWERFPPAATHTELRLSYGLGSQGKEGKVPFVPRISKPVWGVNCPFQWCSHVPDIGGVAVREPRPIH